MWKFTLTIYRDGYNDVRTYRVDHQDQLDADMAKATAKGYRFKLTENQEVTQ